MAIDTSWANVSLLCPFDTGLLDIKGHAITASGGAALSSAVGTPFGAGSALYCNSISKYLSSSSADFAFGSGSYTAEMWIYAPLSHSGNMGLFATSPQAASPTGVLLTLSPTGVLRISETWNTNTIASSAGAVSANTWTHVAVIRSGTTTVIKVNGTQVATGTHSGNYTSTAFVIGGDYTTPFVACLCYFSDVRITNGVARTITAAPSARFPRPTISGHVYDAAAAPVAKTVLVRDRSTGLYLGGANSDPSTGAYTFYPPNFGEFDVARVDELVDPVTDEAVFDLDPSIGGTPGSTLNSETRGRLLVWTNEARVGADGTYFEFDGSADYMQSTSVLYALGTDDFCIDIEFYPISGGRLAGSYNRILQIGPNTTAGTLTIYCNATDNPTRITAQFYDTSWHTVVWSDPTTYANSTWHKMQLRRVSGVFYLTINDVLEDTSAALAYNITGTLLSIGSNTSGTESFYGRLGKIRISRGARRAAAATPTSRLLKMPADGGSGENALIYDRVIPGG